MKLTSIFLAAVIVSAMAGQAADARDHDGWRNHNRAWKNYNKQIRRQQKWNNRVWRNNNPYWNNAYGYGGRARPWDNMHDNSIRALQEIHAMQQAQNRARFWY